MEPVLTEVTIVPDEGPSLDDKSQMSQSQSIPSESVWSEEDVTQKDGVKAPPATMKTKDLYYGIDDQLPWYLTVFLGFQHYLTMVGSALAIPFLLQPALCMEPDDPDKAILVCTLLFVSGIITLLQSTFGVRLPIIQGATAVLLIPSLAMLSLPEWQCPSPSEMAEFTLEEKREIWQIRVREIQGAIIVSSLLEVVLGLTGIVGLIARWVSPLTIAPAIILLGLGLCKYAITQASTNWSIGILTMVLLVFLSQYINHVKLPIPFTKSPKRDGPLRFPLFQLFPVLLTVISCWALCVILTRTDVLPKGNPARTDLKTNIIYSSPWFRVPYPFQWGLPTFGIGPVLGMLSGVLTGIIESLGDYYACARISGCHAPPSHAINRGIFVEGIGCIIAGIFGTGNGTTSYSENIGAISVTKVASRRVVQSAGVVMLICGVLCKVGAVFISIPDPVVGGLFCVVFGMVAGVGISNLKGVPIDSTRNIFIIGVSVFFGLALPEYVIENPVSTGIDRLDEILNVLLRLGMFVAGSLGFFLDNTISGSAEERGLAYRSSSQLLHEDGDDPIYDPPFRSIFRNRFNCFKWIPICPSYSNQDVTGSEFKNKQGT